MLDWFDVRQFGDEIEPHDMTALLHDIVYMSSPSGTPLLLSRSTHIAYAKTSDVISYAISLKRRAHLPINFGRTILFSHL